MRIMIEYVFLKINKPFRKLFQKRRNWIDNHRSMILLIEINLNCDRKMSLKYQAEQFRFLAIELLKNISIYIRYSTIYNFFLSWSVKNLGGFSHSFRFLSSRRKHTRGRHLIPVDLIAKSVLPACRAIDRYSAIRYVHRQTGNIYQTQPSKRGNPCRHGLVKTSDGELEGRKNIRNFWPACAVIDATMKKREKIGGEGKKYTE